MIRLLLLGLLLLTTLSSNETNNVIDDLITKHDSYEISEVNETITIIPLPKVLYLSYEKVPQRVIKGEIFSVTVKTLSTVKEFSDITYKFTDYTGLHSINEIPYRNQDRKYFYDTFYFLTTSSNAILPTITATLHDQYNTIYKDTSLAAKRLNVVTLNPKSNF